mgnify:CR=1 FL=1
MAEHDGTNLDAGIVDIKADDDDDDDDDSENEALKLTCSKIVDRIENNLTTRHVVNLYRFCFRLLLEFSFIVIVYRTNFVGIIYIIIKQVRISIVEEMILPVDFEQKVNRHAVKSKSCKQF